MESPVVDGGEQQTNPGASRLGNFINYYFFNSAEKRMQLIKDGLLQQLSAITTRNKSNYYYVLDIGCNTGVITQLLYTFLQNQLPTNIEIQMIGIDIDPILIERANELNQYKNNIKYYCMDIMSENAKDELLTRLVNVPKNPDPETNETVSVDSFKFDIIMALSVTMWIHLNHGDTGLYKFLDRICKWSILLIIEPQPWKCYKTAVKRLKNINESFIWFDKLTVRHDIEPEISNYITSVHDKSNKYKSIETGWRRTIHIFYSI